MVSYAKNKSCAPSVPVAGHGRRKSRGSDTSLEENGAFLIDERPPCKACHLNPSPFPDSPKGIVSLESQEEDYSQSSPRQYDYDPALVGSSRLHDIDTDPRGSSASSLIPPVGKAKSSSSSSRRKSGAMSMPVDGHGKRRSKGNDTDFEDKGTSTENKNRG